MTFIAFHDAGFNDLLIMYYRDFSSFKHFIEFFRLPLLFPMISFPDTSSRDAKGKTDEDIFDDVFSDLLKHFWREFMRHRRKDSSDLQGRALQINQSSEDGSK
eukprot:TRINITY_DN2143_c0_g1_i2.p1 TRINITY_DN2143_c0_g1~~TRINITY_DN2143_c0_g1_i2.p1  ORF type:complete len:103 (+),score=11.11 TRINITY_DN2143_c0_g1_i2:146-454(+)